MFIETKKSALFLVFLNLEIIALCRGRSRIHTTSSDSKISLHLARALMFSSKSISRSTVPIGTADKVRQTIQDELDNKYVFPKLVDGAIYSYDVGLRKPDKSIYIKACELAKVNPAESVFIDDLIENIDGAKKVGIKGIHYTDIEKLNKSLKQLGIIK